MSNKALLSKARKKASKFNRLNAARERIHRRRLKLDVLETKIRQKLRNIESLQSVLAQRYNSLVYQIQEVS